MPTSPLYSWMLLAALAAVPAQAIAVKGGASPEEVKAVEEASHRAGAHLMSVVQIHAFYQGQGCLAGSGVLLGRDASGGRGFVLTSAHTFGFGIGGVLPEVSLGFGPTPPLPGVPGRLRGVRVHLAPGFWAFPDPRPAKEGWPAPGPWTQDDLALVEFDAHAGWDGLEKGGIRPARLCEGKELEAGAMYRGLIAGFGQFATNTASEAPLSSRVHAGSIRFWRWQYFGLEGLCQMNAYLPQAPDHQPGSWGLQHFVPATILEPPETSGAGESSDLVPADDEAMTMPGDSGGPLFFGSGEDPVVVGICALAFIDPAPGQGAGCGYARGGHFEAVDRHLDWIRGVMAGTAGGGLELTVGAKPSPGGGGPALESKASAGPHLETKEPRSVPAPPPAAPGPVSAPDPGSPGGSPGPALNPDRR